jgi:hypothetical protein
VRTVLTTLERRSLATAFIALSLALLATGAEAAKGFVTGQQVVFVGVVRDSQGEPLPVVRVVLEAHRSALTVPGVKREPKGLTRVPTLAGEDGAYRIEWEWHDYYNSFRLLIVTGTGREPPGEDMGIVEAVELGKLGDEGSTITTLLTVSDSTFASEHRELVPSLGTADPRRIYEEMGKPDRVERMRRGSSEEISWFYFARGRAYRFLDGSLAASEDFAPVKPF